MSRYVVSAWFEGCSDPNWISPEDRERFHLHGRTNGYIFRVLDHDRDYLVVEYGAEIFRVLALACKDIAPAMVFPVGAEVIINISDATAFIREAMWHHGRQEPFFLVSQDGRKKSRRYYPYELTLVR